MEILGCVEILEHVMVMGYRNSGAQGDLGHMGSGCVAFLGHIEVLRYVKLLGTSKCWNTWKTGTHRDSKGEKCAVRDTLSFLFRELGLLG